MTKNWQKYFEQYDRVSFDETGLKKTYGNAMEELYQMFKARLKDEENMINEQRKCCNQ